MTTATDRQAGPRGGAARCARAVVVALLAALAVLVHHDTTSAVTPAHSMSAMAGMDHTYVAMTPAAGMDHTHAAMNPPAASVAHGTVLRTAYPTTGDEGGACSGPGMQHCSAGDTGTAKILPPPAAVTAVRSDAFPSLLTQSDPTWTSYRAPPDLSVLSRLLI
ncbi:hypothetical protein [Streptomyces sp. NPDC047061]|uniref:hypothetical protein n=1 Tax=Streptomyces sp. NPDC047061 TaxID=3154605 RepID=UPI0033EE6D8D